MLDLATNVETPLYFLISAGRQPNVYNPGKINRIHRGYN
jgi:hypothetical protein